MRSNLKTSIDLYCTAAGGQTDNSSLIGRKYRIVDTKYGHVVGEYDTPSAAERAMLSRPYTKIMSEPEVWQTQEARDMARKMFPHQNPDEEGGMSPEESPEVLHKKEVPTH